MRAILGHSVVAMNYVTGISFTALLYLLLHNHVSVFKDRYSCIADSSANLSYTLYVVHMPFLIFVRALLLPEEPWQPSLLHVGYAIAITVLAIAYSMYVSRHTEAKTSQVREVLMGWFSPKMHV